MMRVDERICWNGEERMDNELLLIDKYGDRIAITVGKPIYNNDELDTKIYKILNEIKGSKILYKLPISIELGIDLEEHGVSYVHIYY